MNKTTSIETFFIKNGIGDQVNEIVTHCPQEIHVATPQDALNEYYNIQQLYKPAVVSIVYIPYGTEGLFDVWGFAYGDKRRLACIHFRLEQ